MEVASKSSESCGGILQTAQARDGEHMLLLGPVIFLGPFMLGLKGRGGAPLITTVLLFGMKSALILAGIVYRGAGD